jgi:hypothetical protein
VDKISLFKTHLFPLTGDMPARGLLPQAILWATAHPRPVPLCSLGHFAIFFPLVYLITKKKMKKALVPAHSNCQYKKMSWLRVEFK